LQELITGRIGHPKLEELKEYCYAHRGLHSEPDAPENSLAAFRRAAELGYGAELDVHMTKDHRLVIIHDENAERMTGVRRIIEESTWEEIRQLRLGNSSERIPLLDEVLSIFENKAPLIIEIKPYHNIKELVKAVCERLDSYQGSFCIESFHPMAMCEVRKLRPDFVRGQLAMDFMKEKKPLFLPLRIALSRLWLNVFSKPDFNAYRYEDRNTKPLQKEIRKGIQEVSWTVRNQRDLDDVLKLGAIAIFEHFLPDITTQK